MSAIDFKSRTPEQIVSQENDVLIISWFLVIQRLLSDMREYWEPMPMEALEQVEGDLLSAVETLIGLSGRIDTPKFRNLLDQVAERTQAIYSAELDEL